MPSKILAAAFIVISSLTSLFADIIITIDDMVLNGKILEEDKKNVRFANYHGVFIIDRDKIKEIYRTDSFESDVKILNDRGRAVNREEVRINYDSGQKKIDELDTSREKQKPPASFSLAVTPCIIFNSGKLKNVLPFSYLVSLTGLVPVNEFYYAEKMFLSGIILDAGYLYSEKGERSITGYRASAGPQWKFGIVNGSLGIDWVVSALLGAGWYNVQGLYDEMNAVKWNAGISTGPAFTASRVIIVPALRFDYIYDSTAPLYGFGAALSLGYSF